MLKSFSIGLLSGWIQLTKHKFFEYQWVFGKKLSDQVFDISIRWSRRVDHAGIRFELSIYHLVFVEYAIYDHRHWNHDIDDWDTAYDGNCGMVRM